MRRISVLGLSLGTRNLGIINAELNFVFYSQMKLFKNSWSEKKLQAILAAINRYITKRNIKHIALKIPPSYAHSVAITQLVIGIESLAKSKEINLYLFTLQNLIDSWQTAENQPLTKKQLMKAILERYNLYHIYRKHAKTNSNHYEKIFEAVGAADIVLRKLNSK